MATAHHRTDASQPLEPRDAVSKIRHRQHDVVDHGGPFRRTGPCARVGRTMVPLRYSFAAERAGPRGTKGAARREAAAHSVKPSIDVAANRALHSASSLDVAP